MKPSFQINVKGAGIQKLFNDFEHSNSLFVEWHIMRMLSITY